MVGSRLSAGWTASGHGAWGIALMTLVLLFAPKAAEAQNVSTRVYLTPTSGVQVGRTFVVNLEVNGARGFDEQLIVPNLEPYATYRGAGSSTNMQVVNGQTTVGLVVQIRYEAVQEGTFEIPAIALRAGGQSLTTKPLEIAITAGPPPPPPGSGASENTEAAGIAASDLFITATASKSDVFEGEPVIMEYRIWTRVDVNGYTVTSWPEPEGFWVEELDEAQAQTEPRERNGQQYITALVRRVALVPSGSGERRIDPLTIEAQVRVQRQTNDPMDRIFGRSLRGAIQPTPVSANPVNITVRPLPPGRPQPFSGVVGSLSLDASLDRDTVDANDAVTLTVRMMGSSNLRSIPEPVLDLPDDFEVFPPEVSTSTRRSGAGMSGTRTYEYVMIPRAPGTRTIPAITLGYYDAEAGAYRTASTGDIPLLVTGTVADGTTTAGARGGVTELRRDIRFIRLGDGDLRPTRGGAFDSPIFWLLFLLPLTAVASSFGLRKHQNRLELDVGYARGRRAGRMAKKRFAEANRLATTDDPRAFYAEVATALRGFVADRVNTAEAGLQTAELNAVLGARGVQDTTATDLIDCLDHCDRQRFAPPTSDASERSKFLDRASALMTALDREMKR